MFVFCISNNNFAILSRKIEIETLHEEASILLLHSTSVGQRLHQKCCIKIGSALQKMSCSVSELQRSSCRLRGSSQGSGGGGSTSTANVTHGGSSNMGGQSLNRPQSHRQCCLCWCCCCSCSW